MTEDNLLMKINQLKADSDKFIKEQRKCEEVIEDFQRIIKNYKAEQEKVDQKLTDFLKSDEYVQKLTALFSEINQLFTNDCQKVLIRTFHDSNKNTMVWQEALVLSFDQNANNFQMSLRLANDVIETHTFGYLKRQNLETLNIACLPLTDQTRNWLRILYPKHLITFISLPTEPISIPEPTTNSDDHEYYYEYEDATQTDSDSDSSNDT